MPLQIIECEQGSPEWHQARAGIITASCMHQVMAKGQGISRDTYMRHMIGEVFTGRPCKLFRNADMDRGNELEPEAREVYASTVDEPVEKTGFMKNHDEIGFIGYSADALVGDIGLAEIKTTEPHIQVEILEANRIPPEHVKQIQCGLWVSERQWIDVVVYCPGMPLFSKRAYRDEGLIQNMRFESISFYADMKRRIDNLKNMRIG